MVSAEKKGRYLSPESVEEIRREKQERAEEKAQLRRQAAVRKGLYWAALVTVCGWMIWMVLEGLIDQTIGTVLLAGLAAALGRGTA